MLYCEVWQLPGDLAVQFFNWFKLGRVCQDNALVSLGRHHASGEACWGSVSLIEAYGASPFPLASGPAEGKTTGATATEAVAMWKGPTAPFATGGL